jgi:GMP synthase (glutamine-hydrolysing)
VIEPLRDLFKDKVRQAGLELGIPATPGHAPPFPGPGLAVRILGDITEEKLEILREADAVFTGNWSLRDSRIRSASILRS